VLGGIFEYLFLISVTYHCSVGMFCDNCFHHRIVLARHKMRKPAELCCCYTPLLCVRLLEASPFRVCLRCTVPTRTCPQFSRNGLGRKRTVPVAMQCERERQSCVKRLYFSRAVCVCCPQHIHLTSRQCFIAFVCLSVPVRRVVLLLHIPRKQPTGTFRLAFAGCFVFRSVGTIGYVCHCSDSRTFVCMWMK
jgi:hypothetical protein